MSTLDAQAPRAELLAEHLRNGHTLRFRARGGSMAPLIRDGSVLTVVPLDRWRAGDVLQCARGGNWVVHRLVSWTDSHCVLRGDALQRADAPVPRADVLGRVTHVERRGRNRSVDGLRGRLCRALARLSLGGRPVLERCTSAVRRLRS